jgi:hypothetical protein
LAQVVDFGELFSEIIVGMQKEITLLYTKSSICGYYDPGWRTQFLQAEGSGFSSVFKEPVWNRLTGLLVGEQDVPVPLYGFKVHAVFFTAAQADTPGYLGGIMTKSNPRTTFTDKDLQGSRDTGGNRMMGQIPFESGVCAHQGEFTQGKLTQHNRILPDAGTFANCPSFQGTVRSLLQANGDSLLDADIRIDLERTHYGHIFFNDHPAPDPHQTLYGGVGMDVDVWIGVHLRADATAGLDDGSGVKVGGGVNNASGVDFRTEHLNLLGRIEFGLIIAQMF